jgi:hypothetical protein
MVSEKQDLVIWAAARAIVSTAIIGMAIQGVQTLMNISWSEPEMCFYIGEVGFICVVGTILYVKDLKSKGLLASPRNYLQIINKEFDGGKQIESLFRGWYWPVFLTGFADTAITLGLYFGNFGIQASVVALISSAIVAYGWRNDDKEDKAAHFIHLTRGYLFGLAMVIAGIAIGAAVSVFGVWWVSLLIIVDVSFTGFYTYLDLMEWVHEKEAKAKKETTEVTT